jgi:hypothetical protein
MDRALDVFVEFFVVRALDEDVNTPELPNAIRATPATAINEQIDTETKRMQSVTAGCILFCSLVIN